MPGEIKIRTYFLRKSFKNEKLRFESIMEAFMEDSQIQSIWLSGDDEPHPLKGEQYQGCYFYPEMLSRNQGQKDLNDDESTSESHGKILPLFQLPDFPKFSLFLLFTFFPRIVKQ